MALMREDAVAQGRLANFHSFLEDLAEETAEQESQDAAPVVDDGVSVQVPGLDPRLRSMGVVGGDA